MITRDRLLNVDIRGGFSWHLLTAIPDLFSRHSTAPGQPQQITAMMIYHIHIFLAQGKGAGVSRLTALRLN